MSAVVVVGKPGWQARVEVDADLSKIPDGPIEAAKYAMDQVHSLATPIVEVRHFAPDGRTEVWFVDTADGSVDHLSGGDWRDDPDREEAPPTTEEERLCGRLNSLSHGGGLFRLTPLGYREDEPIISCGNHLGDMLVMDEGATVVPYDENGE